ncbi:MAG: hypothetical protein DMD67_00410 [Gemmatimonadetes bacterium]|nr:MAG: hypothetical protein DMD67_00410 [Gemmatimonadota bacterium]
MRAHRLLVVAVVLGCAGGRAVRRAPEPVPPSPPPVPVPATTTPDSVTSLLATLTVRQQVGQLIIPWLSGNYTALDDSLFQTAARWVDSLAVGGLIVSVGSPFDIAAKLNALQRRSRLPLLVSADLEWGAGMRVVGATAFPQIMAVGATGDPRDAYQIGAAAAVEGRAVGIQLNFAPDARGPSRVSWPSTCGDCTSTVCSPRSNISPATATRRRTRTSASPSSPPGTPGSTRSSLCRSAPGSRRARTSS